MSFRRIFAKIGNFFRRQRAEQDLFREVASHLAMLEDKFLSQGMTLDEARLAARRSYGRVEHAKELHRDERSFIWLEQLLQDLRHAFRSLRKSPGFVAVAMLSLAFGIGVNTSIFTLVNGILLKNLPVPDPHRIVQLDAHLPQFDAGAFSFPVYRELRRQKEIFSDVVGFRGGVSHLDLGGEPAKIELEEVTGTYFAFFNGRPALGRVLDEEDDRLEGAHHVCVLSYEAWQHYFGADPGIVGKSIRIDRVTLRVVGVAAPDFVGAELQKRYDAWASTALAGDLDHFPRENPHMSWIRAMARLRPGISVHEARARLAGASRSIEDALPKDRGNKGAVYFFEDASKGFDSWRKDLHDPLLILMGAVTLVLLVACANLANLLLARTNERHQEFAIKLSLGISRWRLMRQLLVETFVLAFTGGVAAYLLAAGLTRFLLFLFNAGEQGSGLHVAPDASVLLFTFGVCAMTALIAGLYPAWQATRTDSTPALKGGVPQSVRRSMVRRSLILVQVALAIVLLFGASLFTHSLRNLRVTSLGYDIDRILTTEIEEHSMIEALTAASASHEKLFGLLTRVRQLPGVESAAVSAPGVLTGSMMWGDIRVRETSRRIPDVSFLMVTPDYFATMRTPLLLGRDFRTADRLGSTPVAIVNRRLASLIALGQDAVGKHFDGWSEKNLEIIGVSGNGKIQNVREETKPAAYLAYDQENQPSGALEVRSRGAASGLEREVRGLAKAAGLEVSSCSTLEVLRDGQLAQDRLLAFLSSLFGGLGTALALVGIYGLISYSVARRTREVGIRISIGAQRGDVLWLFLREATLLVAGGIFIGLPVALALAGFLRKLLFEVSTSDPVGIIATLSLIFAGGLVACLIPARRATRVNPVQALRYE